jgi:hypothetical protein
MSLLEKLNWSAGSAPAEAVPVQATSRVDVQPEQIRLFSLIADIS